MRRPPFVTGPDAPARAGGVPSTVNPKPGDTADLVTLPRLSGELFGDLGGARQPQPSLSGTPALRTEFSETSDAALVWASAPASS